MGPLIVMVVLVCGYWYTDNHYPSRIRHARSNGWNSYFNVAMHGCRFFLSGLVTTFFVYTTIFFIDFIFNLPLKIWPKAYDKFTSFERFFNSELMGYPSFIWSSAVLAIWIAYRQASDAKKEMQKEESRLKAYREVAKTDPMESLLVQAIDEEKLIFVTLKSRKVYVGFVAAPRFEHSETSHLCIIPYLSGYRDKDSLRFIETHSYVEHYIENNITSNSEPLNLNHFRHIMPMEQVDSVSIFDTSTYQRFKDKDKPKRSFLNFNGK
ncbi:hypothetical protein [Pectobacterium aroidearum]|uniref:hypothetical protein n=1 Tax=Pectobacterium aroidearum TaxID=1201031 RepID=UPI002A825E32|nr:hypothetical protein [Pectobacterium aroidearum]MDY4387746.1 hypothetical protein [Pectobacterium aroidearum]